VRLPISDGIDPVRELTWRYSDTIAVRLPISDGIDPVRELAWSLRSLIAVRLPIFDGIDPVRHVTKCVARTLIQRVLRRFVYIVQFYHA
jgi:hypothetical protein